MEAIEEDQEQTKMKKAIELNLNTSTNSSDDSQESSKSTPNQSKARTYDCTFCKKGFSNAQALGGHMNIHRKDKAKLKQNINKTTTHHQVQQQQINYGNNLDNPKLLKPSSYSPMNSSPEVNWPLFLSHVKETSEGSKEKKQVEKVQLPLVFETSQVPEVEQHGSSGSDLDLELRLGPEPRTPPEDSSTKLGTRKFF